MKTKALKKVYVVKDALLKQYVAGPSYTTSNVQSALTFTNKRRAQQEARRWMHLQGYTNLILIDVLPMWNLGGVIA